MWIRKAGKFMSISKYTHMFIWLMFRFVTTKTRPDFQLNMDTYGGRSHLYFLQLYIWIIFCFIGRHDQQEQSYISSKVRILFILSRLNPYIYQMYTFWTGIQSYHITQAVLRTWIIIRFLSYVAIVHLL